MIRQRALAWAVVLALVATVQSAPLPAQFAAALAQDDSAADTGEPTDLAIVALHCAEAPAAEALTSFIADATLPVRCAPAVGVTLTVTENGDPVSGSPFTTDVDGTAAVPVGLGSTVEIREDPKSLPVGYEPLMQEANGVPYANPVRLDPAVAGAAVLFVNVPSTVVTELAQGSPGGPGEPTDLTVVALQCADAPAAEALTSYFTSGTPPSECAPAEGVTIAVMENEKPLSGSPFQTDADGALAVSIGLGSEVTVEEDLKSLPAGYVPLTQEVNDVPYANPVRLDSAVAGAAVLFVNVPTSVAARLAEGAPAGDAGEATDLAQTVEGGRTGCDPAYPDERTCIAPGRPLAEPCSITDQRNFTVLAPDPRGLDADGDGIGCEPISPSGGTILRRPNINLYTSRGDLRAAPTSTADFAVSASPVRTGDGVWVSPPEGRQTEVWFVDRDRTRAGLWFRKAPDRGGTGTLAVASNPVFIGHGLWSWPNRHDKNDWFWLRRKHDTVWSQPSTITVGNLTVAGFGLGNVAIASNPVLISTGVWRWPDRNHDDWSWHNRFGVGAWHRHNQISVGNITVASSGNGNVAIASNPIFIGKGLWRSPGHSRDGDWFWHGRELNEDWFWRSRFGNGVRGWPDRIAVGNLAVARSGDGNVAVVSNPIFISNGIWSGPNHFGNNDRFRSNLISVGNISVAGSGNGNVAIASNPVFISHGVWEWPHQSGNDDRFRPGLNRDVDWRGHNRFGKGIWGWPSTISVGNLTIAGAGSGHVAIASNPVFISSGVWHWPGHHNNMLWLWPNRGKNVHWRWPNRFGSGVWDRPSNIFVGNLTIARSGSGNIAIVSNPIVISSGVWFVAPERNRDDHWLVRGERDHADEELRQGGADEAGRSGVEPTAIDGGDASEAPPSKIETLDASEQPPLTVNGGLAVEPAPADSTQPASDGSTQPTAEAVEPPSDSTVAPSDGYSELPSDGAGASTPDAPVESVADASAPEPASVASDTTTVDPSYVEPSSVDAGNVDPDYVAPESGADPGYVDPGYAEAEPVYVAPEPTDVDPGYAAPESGYVDAGSDPSIAAPEPSYIDPDYVEPSAIDPGYVAPDPGIEPSYSAPQPSYVDPGVDPGYVAPEPSYVAPESNPVAPNPGIDAAVSGPDPGNFAPESSFVDPGVDAGYVDSGNTNAGNIAPDPGIESTGTVDVGNGAPDSDDGRSERKRRSRD